MLRYIRHVRQQPYPDLPADFQCGPTTCALYLSLQYHALHPEYIYTRIRALPPFRLRLLIILCDADTGALHALCRLGLVSKLAVICTSSEREAARYLETLRSYDGKGAETIQERVGDDYSSRLQAAFNTVRGVNRTDVCTLAFTFGSVRAVADASRPALANCPGLGERKVSRLFAALHQPFRTSEAWEEADEATRPADIAVAEEEADEVAESDLAAEQEQLQQRIKGS